MNLFLSRYCNNKNISSFNIRGGTWFGEKTEIERYYNNNESIKLGGTLLIEKNLNLKNPFEIDAISRNYDFFHTYKFGDDKTKKEIENLLGEELSIFIDVLFCKDDDELLELIKYNLSEEKYNIISKYSFYNQKTMWLDNLLVKRLKLNGYDSLIRYMEGKIFECFVIGI